MSDRSRRGALLALIAVVTLGCSDGSARPSGPTAPGEPENTLPALLISGATPDVDAAVRASVIAAAEELTFVSLPPGALSEAFSVDIRNATRGNEIARAFLIDGGFDPTGVAAAAGDRLELSFTDRSGAVRVEIATVPLRRPPAIVRTSPTKGRTDVPLNVHPRVVFTEPVEAGSLDIELWHDDMLVGDLFVIDAGQPWAVEFQHDLDLNPGTTYELRVNGAQDLQGEFLVAPLTASFTTSGAALSVAGRIAFVSTRDGAPHIYVGELDGSPATRLALGTSPEWSPDGEQIAFTTWPSGVPDVGGTEVWRMNADGANQRTLAGGGADFPSWSPDGRTIAFSRNGAIYSIPINGTDETLLIDEASMLAATGWPISVDLSRPAWSTDGRRLAFNASGLLMTIAADGSGVEWIELEYGMGPVYSRPSWAPDGSRFVVSTSGGMDPTPWITSALPDGRNVEIHAYGLGPDWSPDGRMLVYHRSPSQLQDLPTRIYVGDLTTGTYWLVPIIPPALNPVDPDYSDYDPVWSPARE